MAKHSTKDDQSTDDENRGSTNATGPVAKGAYNDDESVSTKFRFDDVKDNDEHEHISETVNHPQD